MLQTLGRAHCIPLHHGFDWKGNRKILIPPPPRDYSTNRTLLDFNLAQILSPALEGEGEKKARNRASLSLLNLPPLCLQVLLGVSLRNHVYMQ